MNSIRAQVGFLTALSLGVVSTFSSLWAQDKTIPVWPDSPPGRSVTQGEEGDTTTADGNQVAGRPVIRLGNVSQPTLTVYSPPADKNTGAAVMVCPGGAYRILAYDLEGTEVCEWLNSIGVTGVLLKYRVPRAEGTDRPVEPLQDAQRGLSLIRQHASEWGINPERIGVLGFSAGGNLAARLSTNYEKRVYPAQDKTDEVSCRPNFAVLIYPAYLFDPKSEELVASDLPLTEQTPPMFLTMAFDDRVGPENILRFALGLKKVEVPVEVHLYPSGGHGYGLRATQQAATTWPARCEEWLRGSGWLTP